ncbi:hypothetical protein [Pseudoalteromonas ardens]|uniref:hypothetical protein n=1 Tax=Pseudoalteromonas ardens TaxID=3048490 RepID=UPI0024C45DE3|nr:hypothetical protein [Pseudoalteromonas sp. R96]MDK1313202.1 hypothetical protein [Pseudoalteromonas sp. R96]
MKYLKSLLAVCIALNLSACSDDDKIKPPGGGGEQPAPGRVVHDLALTAPQAGRELVEDFPVSEYLDYAPGAQPLTNLTSLDINGPDLHTFQQGIEVGTIDVSASPRVYQPLALRLTALDDIVATEQYEDELWYVTGTNEIFQRSLTSDETTSWRLETSLTITELGLDSDDNSDIWGYDANAHQVIRFKPEDEQLLLYPLSDNMTIQGVSYLEQQLWILASESGQPVVMQFDVSDEQVTQRNGWHVTGFGQAEMTDLTILSGEQVVITTNAQENNLVLLADRDKLLGDGPIEDTGELVVQNRYSLPDEIKQPSGLWYTQQGGWEIVTDQAEVYSLNADLQIQTRTELAFASIHCGQGCTEAVISKGGEIFVLADSKLIGHFTLSEQGYQLVQEYPLAFHEEGEPPFEFLGLAYDALNDRYFLVSNSDNASQQDWLFTLDSQFNLVSRQPLSYTGETAGSLNEYTAMGLYFAEDALWMVSEQFTKVIKLTLSGEIVAVYDLLPEDMTMPSDLVVKDGKIYLIGDHENGEPVPPLIELTIE